MIGFHRNQLFTEIVKKSNYITGCRDLKGLYAMYLWTRDIGFESLNKHNM